MTRALKSISAAAAALALAALAAGAHAQAAKSAKAPKPPPVVYSPEQNLCRASCGDAWVKALACNDEAAACRTRADRSYKQCLPDCAEGKAPLSASFAWLSSPKGVRASPAPALRPAATAAPAIVDDGPESTAAAPWVDARTQWFALPARSPVNLPYTFLLPTQPYAYAGRTDPIRPFVTKAPGLLQVTLVVQAGDVGVALITTDGSALVSKEAAFKPSPTVQTVYFEVGPHLPPVALMARNYVSGDPGGVTIRSVTFARTAVLPAGEAARLGALK